MAFRPSQRYQSWGGWSEQDLTAYIEAGNARYGAVEEARRRETLTATTTPAQSSVSPGAKESFEKAIAQYAPEGGFGKGVEAGLERGRVKAVASGTQSLVSAGLAGTSVVAGLGKKYEEEVAAPTRAGVESERAQQISSLQAAYAGMEQGAYESSQNRALQLSMQSYGGGGGVTPAPSTPGLDAFGKPLRGSVQQQQLDIQRQKLAGKKTIQKQTVSELTGGISGYGAGYYGGDEGEDVQEPPNLVQPTAYQDPAYLGKYKG